YYQSGADGRPKAYVSFKLEPRSIEDLPEPRPRYEIFCYSPRVEGVHLRFGPVARGGLRWSDRREDFRTEVLGLVKAQMVKNAVIVPVGSKGGFYCKQLPDASDREAWLAEGVDCYKTFIASMLDVTDNREAHETVPPRDVVRWDGDDSYLVVAADKGTATFSDIANQVSADYGYWLGDAFASGGSVGYDHKAMGITARGAWVSVQRHFREMGIDCQNQDFTCVGIGDMSGDVFGNGMLLSERTRLVAAFDHRHIFVDPDPDLASSYAERRRLFDLPRSSWADYDESLISDGGGIFPRTRKSIPVSAAMRAALGLDDGVEAMTPPQLLSAILRAPVDLLWNGGIGTYVKATSETHDEVGDKANNAIRVSGAQLRCRCVGEGGNLGFTQLGRIEYARSGGRINTDFIDNSAGVDTSDHEVNIKILLDRAVERDELGVEDRNELLPPMTEEVARLVLEDNYDQNVSLAGSVHDSVSLLHSHAGWIRRLERSGLIDREIEFLPSDKEIEVRRSEGAGLTAPELSVLLAYTKIVLADELVESDIADDDYFRTLLFSYFPSDLRQKYRAAMETHPLRREIIVTALVNEMVNAAGITFFHRLSGETGASAPELARAHAIASEIYDSRAMSEQINSLDNVVSAEVQEHMRGVLQALTERASRWLVNNRRNDDVEASVEYFGTLVQRLVRGLPDLFVGRERDAWAHRAEELRACGVPEDVAARFAALGPAYAALTIADNSRRMDVDVMAVAAVHFALGETLGLDRLADRILALPRDDRWRTMARAALRDDLQAVHAELTARVMEGTDPGDPAQPRVDAWKESEGAVLARADNTLQDIWGEDTPDLARLSVGLRVVRTMLT
ncbi:MAG: NAD-glutamate dehydrogenase domain-containing protein, partial [Nocardioidaceae bacterium]